MKVLSQILNRVKASDPVGGKWQISHRNACDASSFCLGIGSVLKMERD